MRMGSKIIFSSLTSAMFTDRKTFSSSLHDSATRELETATTCSNAELYSATAALVDASFTPPTTLGMVRVENFSLPGSSRSGEKASRKSSGQRKPLFSRMGSTSSSVVPG